MDKKWKTVIKQFTLANDPTHVDFEGTCFERNKWSDTATEKKSVYFQCCCRKKCIRVILSSSNYKQLLHRYSIKQHLSTGLFSVSGKLKIPLSSCEICEQGQQLTRKINEEMLAVIRVPTRSDDLFQQTIEGMMTLRINALMEQIYYGGMQANRDLQAQMVLHIKDCGHCSRTDDGNWPLITYARSPSHKWARMYFQDIRRLFILLIVLFSFSDRNLSRLGIYVMFLSDAQFARYDYNQSQCGCLIKSSDHTNRAIAHRLSELMTQLGWIKPHPNRKSGCFHGFADNLDDLANLLFRGYLNLCADDPENYSLTSNYTPSHGRRFLVYDGPNCSCMFFGNKRTYPYGGVHALTHWLICSGYVRPEKFNGYTSRCAHGRLTCSLEMFDYLEKNHVKVDEVNETEHYIVFCVSEHGARGVYYGEPYGKAIGGLCSFPGWTDRKFFSVHLREELDEFGFPNE